MIAKPQADENRLAKDDTDKSAVNKPWTCPAQLRLDLHPVVGSQYWSEKSKMDDQCADLGSYDVDWSSEEDKPSTYMSKTTVSPDP